MSKLCQNIIEIHQLEFLILKKVRKIQEKVTKVMDYFNKYTLDVKRKNMFDKETTLSTKMTIAKSLQKMVQQ